MDFDLYCSHAGYLSISFYWHDRMRPLCQGVRIWNFEEKQNKTKKQKQNKKNKKNLSAGVLSEMTREKKTQLVSLLCNVFI